MRKLPEKIDKDAMLDYAIGVLWYQKVKVEQKIARMKRKALSNGDGESFELCTFKLESLLMAIEKLENLKDQKTGMKSKNRRKGNE